MQTLDWVHEAGLPGVGRSSIARAMALGLVTIDTTWSSVHEGVTTDRDGIELGMDVAGQEGTVTQGRGPLLIRTSTTPGSVSLIRTRTLSAQRGAISFS